MATVEQCVLLERKTKGDREETWTCGYAVISVGVVLFVSSNYILICLLSIQFYCFKSIEITGSSIFAVFY